MDADVGCRSTLRRIKLLRVAFEKLRNETNRDAFGDTLRIECNANILQKRKERDWHGSIEVV